MPAPTPFKAWLHDKMGFTDDIDVLFTEEVYEVQLAKSNLTVNEAESPFALLEHVFADTNQQSIAADAYRQVTYVNDTTYENAQVLMEYAINGNLGTTTTAYSFGVQRESFVETASGMGAGANIGGIEIIIYLLPDYTIFDYSKSYLSKSICIKAISSINSEDSLPSINS